MDPTPPTAHSGSRRQENLSGQESNESRIDSHDQFRMGGPGRLPDWPVAMGPSQQLSAQVGSDLVALAQQQIERYGLNYELVTVCQRYSEGTTPTAADNTVYIRLHEPSANWVPAIDALITSTQQMGFIGRIELVDLRAAGGPKTFAPLVPNELLQAWPSLEERVICRLSANYIDWRLVTLANRGYTEETAVLTLVVKATIPSTAELVTMKRNITGDVDGYGLSIEIVRSDMLWGAFAAATLEQSVLGWPFTREYNAMGMSVGCSDGVETGTLGGYLKVIDSQGRENFLGVTCCHVIRRDPQGQVDRDLESTRSIDLSLRCLSPSRSDIELAKVSVRGPTSITQDISSIPPAVRDLQIAQERQRTNQLQEIDSFDANLGKVVATSDYRNMSNGSTFTDPQYLQDWATVMITNGQRSVNFLGDFVSSDPLWNPNGPAVQGIASLPEGNPLVFKRGRTTGITAGVLGGLCPAAVRLAGDPAGIHHRGWMVFPRPSEKFAQPGDSGAWVLTASGQAIGLLTGGDNADGTALFTPLSLVVKNMEKVFGSGDGGVQLA